MYHTIKERKKAPKLDSAAAKRFIRSGLFDLNSIKQGKRKVFKSDDEEENGDGDEKPAKRKSTSNNEYVNISL